MSKRNIHEFSFQKKHEENKSTERLFLFLKYYIIYLRGGTIYDYKRRNVCATS